MTEREPIPLTARFQAAVEDLDAHFRSVHKLPPTCETCMRLLIHLVAVAAQVGDERLGQIKPRK